MAAEIRKHLVNDPKCSELGWVSIPLAVEIYGCWGAEAQCTVFRLTSIPSGHSDAVQHIQGHHYIYQRFSLTLIRANARALPSCSGFRWSEGGIQFCLLHVHVLHIRACTCIAVMYM